MLSLKKIYLKDSTTLVIGFKQKKNLYFSETKLKGYTIGVAYIHNCTPKLITKVKSRYLLVKEDINKPKPRPISAT